jgi:hypothetical protein
MTHRSFYVLQRAESRPRYQIENQKAYGFPQDFFVPNNRQVYWGKRIVELAKTLLFYCWHSRTVHHENLDSLDSSDDNRYTETSTAEKIILNHIFAVCGKK